MERQISYGAGFVVHHGTTIIISAVRNLRMDKEMYSVVQKGKDQHWLQKFPGLGLYYVCEACATV